MDAGEGDAGGRFKPAQAFLRRITYPLRSRGRPPSTPDADPLLHPKYGWQEVNQGVSWRKLRLFYGSDTRRPRYWWLLVPLGLIAFLHGLWAFFYRRA